MLMKCRLCGKEFKTSSYVAKYCSDNCRKAATKKKRSAWDAANAGYMKNYMRERRKSEGNDHGR